MTQAVEQARQIGRVKSRIADLVEAFVNEVGAGHPFRMAALLAWIAERAQVAPDSPGRILRLLKREGRINYRIVNRSQSLYEVL